MSTNNDWIKMSERKPTEADLPVWAIGPGRHVYGPAYHLELSCFTHWRPAAADIPAPPKEETQADKDEAAFKLFWNTPKHPLLFGQDVWHAALAYERAEVGKLLRPLDSIILDPYDALRAIRARCGGAK